MNKEEKEAIDRIQKRIKDNEDYSTNQVWLTEDVRCAKALLNLIQKQEFIIDKIWDLYYEYLSIRPASGMKFLKSKGFDVSKCEKCSFDDDNINCKECIKEYFKKEVEKDVKD